MDNGIRLIVRYADKNIDVAEVQEILSIELQKQIKAGLYTEKDVKYGVEESKKPTTC